jgi:hypothetical protein
VSAVKYGLGFYIPEDDILHVLQTLPRLSVLSPPPTECYHGSLRELHNMFRPVTSGSRISVHLAIRIMFSECPRNYLRSLSNAEHYVRSQTLPHFDYLHHHSGQTRPPSQPTGTKASLLGVTAATSLTLLHRVNYTLTLPFSLTQETST